MQNVIFGVGRCNPPTLGHWHMIQMMTQMASALNCKAEFHVVDGEQSGKDRTKNPLTPEQRVAILRSWFPSVRFEISQSAYDSMEVLEVQNKLPLHWICGSDRAKKYAGLLAYAGFDKGNVCGLNRDEGPAKGISGTAVREAVLAGNFAEFSRMMPSDFDQIEEVYDLLRKALTEDGSR